MSPHSALFFIKILNSTLHGQQEILSWAFYIAYSDPNINIPFQNHYASQFFTKILAEDKKAKCKSSVLQINQNQIW